MRRDAVHPGSANAPDDGLALSVEDGRLARLLLQDGAPEEVLGELLAGWLTRGTITWGAFFLRRPGGWVRLAERPIDGAKGGRHAADARRVLERRWGPSEPAADATPTEPAIEGRLFGYDLGLPGAELGRLLIAPSDPARAFQLPRTMNTALALFLNRLPALEESLDALPGVIARRMIATHGKAARAPTDHVFPEFIGKSPGLLEVLRLIEQAAPSEASIIIHGESGTGKELVARAIHRLSPRRVGPFVAENCAAFSTSLLESEIFGSEKGSFTGSTHDRPGLMERADGGTLFLDEVAEMSLPLQAKLLRALQEREVRRIGGSRTIPVNFRLITATHRDLDREVAAGRFRADLLFRIHVIRVPLPALRERASDIPLLASHFLSDLAQRSGQPDPGIDDDAMLRLQQHDWPGNVRELRNELERSFILSPRRVTLDSLSDRMVVGALPQNLARRVRRELGSDLRGLERRVLGGVIREVLDETGGNKTEAARILGLPKTTFYRRLAWYGIEGEGGPPEARQ